MKEINKCIGVSKAQFSILASAYGIDHLFCFSDRRAQAGSVKEQREEYIISLFYLYKAGLLTWGKDSLVPTGEIGEMFSLLRNCKRILVVECKDRSIPDLCLYFSAGEEFVLLRAGTREDEYVKMEKCERKGLQRILEESGMLPEPDSTEVFRENRREHELVGEEAILFLKEEKKDIRKLKEIPQTEVIFTIRDGKSSLEQGCLALLHQPIQDKVILINGNKEEIFPYSLSRIMESIQKMLED
ncbi:MAG: hypothetical protein IJP31_11660 [Lachnospiraceae bacterium]|nr:hypothetical protein [Lachnospiraceae bacterium]